MAKPSILIIEDDEDIQRLLSYQFIKNGYSVSCADTGEEGLAALAREHFDCLILDIMLPGMDGLEVCKRIRQGTEHPAMPIIMLTAKGEEQDIITGLDSGADDYVTKPFSPKILLARVNVLLRRSQEDRETAPNGGMEKYKFGEGLEIDYAGFCVTLDGQPLSLTTSEFKILSLLSRNPGRVFSRQQIIDEVMGHGYMVTSRTVDVQIHGLRKKLGCAGSLIETVRGVGYRFKRDD